MYGESGKYVELPLKSPIKFNTINEAIEALSKRLKLPIDRWLNKSKIYRFLIEQKRLL